MLPPNSRPGTPRACATERVEGERRTGDIRHHHVHERLMIHASLQQTSQRWWKQVSGLQQQVSGRCLLTLLERPGGLGDDVQSGVRVADTDRKGSEERTDPVAKRHGLAARADRNRHQDLQLLVRREGLASGQQELAQPSGDRRQHDVVDRGTGRLACVPHGLESVGV